MFGPNAGLAGIVMIEAAAVLLLLVLFWLLAKGFSARFLRIWMAGWSVYACFAACQLISAWQPRLPIRMLSLELSFGAAVLFFSAVLEFANQRKHLRWIWPLAAIVSIGLQADFVHSGQPVSGQWTITILKAALYLAGGWLLWRSPERKQGHGVLLLAPAMILVGLNGLDAPNWPAQALQAARLSFNGVFVVAMGIAMAVLVLEAGRARTED